MVTVGLKPLTICGHEFVTLSLKEGFEINERGVKTELNLESTAILLSSIT